MTIPAQTADSLLTLSHPWTVADAAALTRWVDEALTAYHAQVAEISGRAENALRPYDDAVALLSAVGSQLGLLNSVHPDKAIRDTAQAEIEKVSQAGVALSLNREVFEALAVIPAQGLDPTTTHYLERTLLGYRLAGVDRDEITRERLKALQDQATVLSLTFSRNVQEGAGRVVVKDPAELEGLPADYIASHPPAAAGEHTGSIVLTTDFPDYLPVMTFARSAALRRRMFLAYQTRAFPQNRDVLIQLLRVRAEIAHLLGFNSWADLATADQMMGSAVSMQAFLDELDGATREGAGAEYAALLEFTRQAAREAGELGTAQLDAASRGYCMEQYRRARFAFDSQEVRPYFAYSKVQGGVLTLVEELFRVRFARVADAEVWHPVVTAWDVFDAQDGEKLGRFYLDMHPREGKDKWFSAAPLIPGIRGRQLPEAALVCNFPEPTAEDPGLLQHSDVTTFLHEFGHLMHALLGARHAWAGVSGIATEGDFVEVPSQMLEEFFREPRLLARFAHHYETGEPIPAVLVERMKRAGAFGRADAVRTQLFYTRYSLDTHRLDPETLDLDTLMQEDYRRFLPYAWVEGNRMYASFTHLTGYSSNYYTYLYDKVIALDFFEEFAAGRTEQDLLAGAVAARYRTEVIEPGGAKPGRALVEGFLGRPTSPDAFSAWLREGVDAETASR